MTTTIDLTTLPANVPSLCIPRVFPNIDERRIRGIFDALDMGEIERIDIIKKNTEKGEKFNRVFIHWKRWNRSDNANQARERLLNGKEIKIVYDDPWFWKISAYREPVARPRPVQRAIAPRLQFDSDEERPRHDDRRREPRRDDRRTRSPQRRPSQVQIPRTPDCSPPRRRQDEGEE